MPLWLIFALVNMSIGVLSAGYTVLQELPFLALVFLPPALVALAAKRHFARAN